MDPAAQQRAAESIDLVHQVVRGVSRGWPHHVDRDELTSAGLVGLVQAAERWDEAHGVPFRTYAAQRIKGSVLDAARSADPIGRDVRTRLRRAEEARERLRSRGVEPTVEAIAGDIGCDADRLRHNLAARERMRSTRLDLTAGDEASPLSERLADPLAADPVLELERLEDHRLVREALDRLPDRLRMIMVGIYLEGRTAESIARFLGVTPSRISQLHSQGLARLRAELADRMQPA